jgi:ATP-binding cassette, subfamily C, bacterial CydD
VSDIELLKQEKKAARAWLKLVAQDAKLWITLTILISLVNGLLIIFQMYVLSYIIYVIYIKDYNPYELVNYFIVLVGAISLRAIASWGKEVIGFKSSATVRRSVRYNLLSYLNKLGPIKIQNHSTGELVSAVMEHIEGLHKFLVYYLPQMSIVAFLPIIILIFIFKVNFICGVILLICAPLIPLFMALVGMGAESVNQKHFKYLSRMSAHFLDTIQGLRTLKLLGKSKQQERKIFNVSDEYRKKTMSVLKIAFLSSAVLELFSSVSIALIAVYIGLGFINVGTASYGSLSWGLGGMTLQGALFVLLLCPEFFLPFRELGTHYHAKAEAVGAALEIKKIFESEKYSLEEGNSASDEYLEGDISLSFSDLSINYEGKKDKALNAINLNIKAGEKVAIVGPSGAGKTTLFNTVLNFIKPSSGSVYVNDVDLSSINIKEWYSSISWLKQNPTLFSGSIKENLLLANPEATDEECVKALSFANLSDFLMELPEGLDTLIGENNIGLSGGQVQRVAIARIYIQNRGLLLLDEPTSSLDKDYQEMVINNLSNFWIDKTVVLLTHRLEILHRVDRVIVLDKGKIVQDGTLNLLLEEKSGLMYKLFNEWRG